MTEHRMKMAAVKIATCAVAVTAIAGVTSCYPAAPPQPVDGSTGRGAGGIKGDLDTDEKVTQRYFLTLGWGDDLPDSAVWEGSWGPDNVQIRLVPASTSPVVAWENALSTDPATYSGHLVLKIIVLENKRVNDLGLGGLETGYLWIGKYRDKNNQMKQGAAIYTLMPNGKAMLAKEMIVNGKCAENHGGRAMAKARPVGECKDKIPMTSLRNPSGTASFSSFRTRAGPAMPAPAQGLWVTCPGGCCEASSVDSPPF